MPTPEQVQAAVIDCLKYVPFEHLELDAPFDDFWKRVDEQDARTGRQAHRVDLFIKCLRDKLRSGVLVSRDMLLEGDLATPRDIVNIIVG